MLVIQHVSGCTSDTHLQRSRCWEVGLDAKGVPETRSMTSRGGGACLPARGWRVRCLLFNT